MPDDNLLRTFWRNSFGSDELEHYSAEYTWLANQMAHAMMAFCLVACWALFVFNLKQRLKAEDDKLRALRQQAEADREAASAIASHPVATGSTDLIVSREKDHVRATNEADELQAKIAARGWFTRHIYTARTDLLMAIPFLLLVLKEAVDITTDFLKFSGGPILPHLFNPLLDSVTDLMFWYAGMFLALFVSSFYFDMQRYRLPGAVLGFAACIGVGYFWLGTHWLNQKKTFDRSGLPLNYHRLVKLTTDWSDPHRKNGHPFLPERKDEQHRILMRIQGIASGETGSPTRGHFVLTGGLSEDRTDLAVSLGCEFTFRLRFDERTQAEEQRRKVIYTTVVHALDHPDGLVNGNNKSTLRCVIIDDLDVSIDPPIELLTDATKSFPVLRQFYSNPTLRRIELAAAGASTVSGKTLPDDLKGRLKKGQVWKAPKDGGPTPPPRELDDIKTAVQSVLTTKEQADEEKRLSVFVKMRDIITAPESHISTVWVLSNTGIKRADPTAPDPQRDNREKWLYLIAYLTGTTREQLEQDRIEFVRPK